MKYRLLFVALCLTLLLCGGLLVASFSRRAALAKDDGSPTPSAAAGVQTAAPQVTTQQAVNFAETLPLSQIQDSGEPTNSFRLGKVQTSGDPDEEETITRPLSGQFDSPEALQASVQTEASAVNVAAPTANFEGLSSQDNANVIGGRVNPPDTNGDVGLTQYVQTVNLLFRVFDKTTGAPLTPPRRISSLFGALPATSRCRTRDDGDPIVLYDSFANRWFISQFVAGGGAPFAQCIAISQTSDATGAYFVYEFTSPNTKFADYPHYGVWPDGYYATVNQFQSTAGVFRGAGVYAFDRTKMLSGDPTASYIYFDLATTFPNSSGMLPSDADGLLPPPAGAPNVIAEFDANEFGGTDSLLLYNFHADFGNPAASTFTQRSDSPLIVAAFDPLDPNGQDDIEQPLPAPTTAFLDAIGSDRLLHRMQYRNFGTSESLTVNHTVNVGTRGAGRPTATQYRAAPRYYQLQRTSPTGNFIVQNQGTFAPADTDERWCGSAALDSQGNLGLGYSVSSRTTFPSIRYTGRLATDLANVLQSESTLIAGKGVQMNSNSRWGDYSALTVDPVDDCTFYYTTEYYAFTHRTPAVSPFGVNWQTRIGSFKFPQCGVPTTATLNVTARDRETNAVVKRARVTIDGVFYGTTLSNGTFSAKLKAGNHTVSLSAPGSSAKSSQSVSVAKGTVNVSLAVSRPETGSTRLDPARTGGAASPR
ncbi:MAG TPA: hypothetical protein VM864_03620 [Pyrinomonadaceae bacterium]|jgi:hypothetical protein|nr:hypothetical protein [Pyrinomonadaceae bacterium]